MWLFFFFFLDPSIKCEWGFWKMKLQSKWAGETRMDFWRNVRVILKSCSRLWGMWKPSSVLSWLKQIAGRRPHFCDLHACTWLLPADLLCRKCRIKNKPHGHWSILEEYWDLDYWSALFWIAPPSFTSCRVYTGAAETFSLQLVLRKLENSLLPWLLFQHAPLTTV